MAEPTQDGRTSLRSVIAGNKKVFLLLPKAESSSSEASPRRIGTAKLMAEEPGKTNPKVSLHGHALPEDLCAVRDVSIDEAFFRLKFPFSFKSSDDIPETLGDIKKNMILVWNMELMEPWKAWKNPGSAQSPSPISTAPEECTVRTEEEAPVNLATGDASLARSSEAAVCVPPNGGGAIGGNRSGTPSVSVSGIAPSTEPPSQALSSSRNDFERALKVREEEGSEKLRSESKSSSDADSISSSEMDSEVELDAQYAKALECVAQVHLEDYRRVLVLADVGKLTIPPLRVRELSLAHVEKYVEIFSTGGYGTGGHIAVCARDATEEEDVALKIIQHGSKLASNCWVIDGQHRLTALLDPRARKVQGEEVEVSLWIRKDGRPIEHAERLEVGRILNEMSSTVRSTDFLDDLYTTISYAKLQLAGRGRVTDKRVSPTSLGSLFERVQLLGKKGLRQYTKHAVVALGFAQHPELYEQFKSIPGSSSVGISHISNPGLWQTDNPLHIIMCLHAVCAYLQNINRGGRFDECERAFYTEARDLLDCVHILSRKAGLSLEDFVNLEVCAVPRQSKLTSIRDQFVLTAAKFQNPKNPGSAQKFKMRQKNFEKWILKRVPDLYDSLRSVPASDSISNKRLQPERSSRAKTVKRVYEDMERIASQPKQKYSGGKRWKHTPAKSVYIAPISSTALPLSKIHSTSPLVTAAAVSSVDTPVPTAVAPDTQSSASVGLSQATISGGNTVSSEPRPQSALTNPGTARSTGYHNVHEGSTESRLDRNRKALSAALEEARKEEESNDASKGPSDHFDDRTLPICSLPFVEDPYKDSNIDESGVTPAEGLRYPRKWVLEDGDRPMVTGKSIWLSFMGFQEKNRANHVVSTRDVEDIHGIIYRHAAKASLHISRYDEEAKLDDTAAMSSLSFFASKRSELEERGWTVFTGFVADDLLPSQWWGGIVGSRKHHDATRFLSFWESNFPGEALMRRSIAGISKKILEWSPIINVGGTNGEDVRLNRSGKSRFSTTNFGMTKALELCPQKHFVVRLRGLLDVRLGVLASALRLRYYSFHNPRPAPSQLHFPVSSGRVLLTGKNAPAQKVHRDFAVPPSGRPGSCSSLPGYFFLVTGAHPAPIWICDRSHHLAYYTDSQRRSLADIFKLEKQVIPAHSIFVCRGDVSHAGVWSDDDPEGRHNARYHIYYVREGVFHGDAIHLDTSFEISRNVDPERDAQKWHKANSEISE